MLQLALIFEYAILALAAFALFVTPNLVASSMFFPYITGKALEFRVVAELMFFIYLGLALVNPKRYVVKPNALTYSLAAFLGIVFLADIFGVNPDKSFFSNFERMEGFITLAHLFAFYISLQAVLRLHKNWGVYLLHAILAGFVFVSMDAWKEYFSGTQRVASSLGNAIYLAIYALSVFYLSAFLYFRESLSKAKLSFIFSGQFSQQISEKLFLIFIGFSALVVLVLTGTRGTFLALIVSLLVLGLAVVLFERDDKLFKRLALSGLVLAVAGVVLLFGLKSHPEFKDNYYVQRLTNFKLEGTIAARLHAWQIAIEGIKQRPILGWGQENYHYVFNQYYHPAMFTEETWFDRTHNIFLGWATEAGLLGLVGFLATFAAALYLLYNSKFSSRQKWILFAFFVGYLVHNSFVFDNLVSYLIVYTLFAYISAFYSADSMEKNKSEGELVLNETLAGYVLAGFLVLGIVFAILLNYPVYKANKELIKALRAYSQRQYEQALDHFKNAQSSYIGEQEAIEQLTTKAIALLANPQQKNSTITQQYFTQAEKGLLRLLENSPNDVRVLYFLSNLYEAAGKLELAEKYLQKALEVAPNRQLIMLKLSGIYKRMNNQEKAIQYAKQAFEVYPLPETMMFYIKTLQKYNKQQQINDLLSQYGIKIEK